MELGITLTDAIKKKVKARMIKAFPGRTEMIGIAIGNGPNVKPIFDVAYFNVPELTPDMIQQIKAAKEELGYFKNPVISNSKEMKGKY